MSSASSTLKSLSKRNLDKLSRPQTLLPTALHSLITPTIAPLTNSPQWRSICMSFCVEKTSYSPRSRLSRLRTLHFPAMMPTRDLTISEDPQRVTSPLGSLWVKFRSIHLWRKPVELYMTTSENWETKLSPLQLAAIVWPQSSMKTKRILGTTLLRYLLKERLRKKFAPTSLSMTVS